MPGERDEQNVSAADRAELASEPTRQWQLQSRAARADTGVSLGFNLWTGRDGFVGEGVGRTARVLDLIDVAACARLKDLEQCGKGCKSKAPVNHRDAFNDFLLDYSQSHSRKPWTRRNGVNPTFTTSTELYSFGADRIVLPREMMLMHGFPPNAKIPKNMRQCTLKNMVGNGMSVPCVATVLWSWHVMKHRQFEAPQAQLD